MDVNKILPEALDGLWNNANYGGTSDPPRKDFSPQSSARGYSYPYQTNTNATFPATPEGPETPVNLAWPLQTITYDLADSFTYLLTATNKLENCKQLNTAISDKQKKKLESLIEFAAKILSAIQKLDAEVNIVANLAGQQPPLNPRQERNPNIIAVPMDSR